MKSDTMNTMDNTADLERALAAMTSWTGGPETPGSLWRKALEQAAPGTTSAQSTPFWQRRIGPSWVAIAACLFLVLIVTAALLPAMGKARASARRTGESSPPAPPAAVAEPAQYSYFKSERSLSYDRVESLAPAAPGLASTPATSPAPISPDRFVIRKATLDLTSPQVRATFSKVGLVINEALGEYIETSSLTGEGPTAAATITLRVASSRLSEVLNQLRPLGTVTSEAATGQDVTDTVVDLEARTRNEQRIERELLALIDKRPDAPLKDLMEIRTQLATVRGQIESLTGQRERLGRLVSLATVLVTIRAADSPKPVEKTDGIGEYFLTSIDSAWTSALHALADTAAFLIRVVIGGIVWWILAIMATVMVWKLYRRALANIAAEPPPVG